MPSDDESDLERPLPSSFLGKVRHTERIANSLVKLVIPYCGSYSRFAKQFEALVICHHGGERRRLDNERMTPIGNPTK